MSIELSLPRRRHAVLFVEVDPPDVARQAFVERGFAVSRCTVAELASHATLSGAAAVVLIQDPASAATIGKQLREHAGRLLDFDCRVFVRSADATSEHPDDPRAFITNATRNLLVVGLDPLRRRDGDPPFPYIRVVPSNASWSDLANTVVAYPPGAAPRPQLRLDGGATLTPSQRILIERAFHDCDEVHLIAESGGRSGVAVYRAYAQLERGLLGAWPLPYFVKIGNRDDIFTEYLKYEGHVDPYVPFHLGPHLIHERCCLGARDGVIVGDFVEESEALAICARGGRAAAAIACLFDRTLRGWHRFAVEESRPVGTLPDTVPPGCLTAANRLGTTPSFVELQRQVSTIPRSKMLVGPIHGDLHASNVRVRGTDAIVIDFLASKRGAILRDPAALEASLLVECLTEPTPLRAWFAEVDDLYAPTTFDMSPMARHPTSPAAWFRACVRQVRMHARQMERGAGQYARTLAMALVHKASKPATDPRDVERRGAAYFFGARLLSHFAAGGTL